MHLLTKILSNYEDAESKVKECHIMKLLHVTNKKVKIKKDFTSLKHHSLFHLRYMTYLITYIYEGSECGLCSLKVLFYLNI